MMDSQIRAAVDAWLNDPAIDEADKRPVRELRDRGDEQALVDQFYKDLDFGTGGMRGVMGPGRNRMNVYTVGAAAQGLASYVAKLGDSAKKAGVVIAHDSRRQSDVFARRIASVMAGNGVVAYLFESLRPTPELSFAIRHLKCTAGVMITASHNPAPDNGMKVYWDDGAQVVPPHDRAIIDEFRRVGAFANVRSLPWEEAARSGLVRMIGREVDEAFLAQVQKSCLSPETSRQQGKKLKIVYTPLHGTGAVLVPEALRRRGFEQVTEVPEQAVPDGGFPTVKSPNPEEAAALDLGIRLAKKTGADLVIATDPDADRMGIAVRPPGGDFVLMNGNQIAALLTYYICEQHRARGTFPKNAVVISTIVSGDMMKDIARSYGAEVIEVLTGFKYIAEKIRQFEAQGTVGTPSKTYLFGAEESYGYMPGTFTRDKDAVTSTAFLADLAAVVAERGSGLHALLTDLFRKFGYYQESVRNLTLPGKEGADRIVAMMQSLRANPPKTLGGLEVTEFGDLHSGERKDPRTGQEIGKYDLPSSEVLMFHLADGTKAVVRPSGTEPKIKFYVLTREPGEDLERARTNASARLTAILADLEQLATRGV